MVTVSVTVTPQLEGTENWGGRRCAGGVRIFREGEVHKVSQESPSECVRVFVQKRSTHTGDETRGDCYVTSERHVSKYHQTFLHSLFRRGWDSMWTVSSGFRYCSRGCRTHVRPHFIGNVKNGSRENDSPETTITRFEGVFCIVPV